MIAILQPLIPHYREDFFKGINEQVPCEIFTYEGLKASKRENYRISDYKVKKIKHLFWKGLLAYSIRPLLSNKYDILVLMLHFPHLSTWLLLLLKPFHKKRIILWGHGISVKRYLKEEKKPSILLKAMIRLADGIWVYTPKEKRQWKSIFPDKPIISLNNTISGIDQLLALNEEKINRTICLNYGHLGETRCTDDFRDDYMQDFTETDKQRLKKKYGINQQTVFIFCARFDNPYRRIDILVDCMEKFSPEKYAFIIIGEGKNKPYLKKYPHVFDFGMVYDRQLKNELFLLADLYFQPGWAGLSIVEAMAYGKPVITFRRSENIYQCVEYNYIENGKNGFIVSDINELTLLVGTLDRDKIDMMGLNALLFARQNLRMKDMVSNAIDLLKLLAKQKKTTTDDPEEVIVNF